MECIRKTCRILAGIGFFLIPLALVSVDAYSIYEGRVNGTGITLFPDLYPDKSYKIALYMFVSFELLSVLMLILLIFCYLSTKDRLYLQTMAQVGAVFIVGGWTLIQLSLLVLGLMGCHHFGWRLWPAIIIILGRGLTALVVVGVFVKGCCSIGRYCCSGGQADVEEDAEGNTSVGDDQHLIRP